MFARSHGYSTGEMGTALFLLGIPGIIGTFLGGYLADRLGLRDMHWYTWLPALAIICYVPYGANFFTSAWNMRIFDIFPMSEFLYRLGYNKKIDSTIKG